MAVAGWLSETNVAEVAKTFGWHDLITESLGDFRYGWHASVGHRKSWRLPLRLARVRWSPKVLATSATVGGRSSVSWQPSGPNHLPNANARMGIHDRAYSRAEQTPWDRMQRSRSVVVTLIVVTLVAFVVQILGGRPLENLLQIRPSTLIRPWLWFQTVTYGFLHNPQDPFHVGFNMLGLYIFGRSVEQRIGGGEFLRFYLVSLAVGGLVAMLLPWAASLRTGEVIDVPTIGASGAVVAVTVLFACYYPDQTVLLLGLIPMKAWVMASLFVGLDVYQAMTDSAGRTAVEVHLAGAAFGFLYARRAWRLDWLGGSFWTDIPAKIRRRSTAAKLRIHDPDRKIADEEAEADRILAKIHASGEASLTGRERRTLQRYSERKRQDRQRK